jgi:ankyrin repeat protein
LHVATDWPGSFPNGPAVIAALIDAGADPNARCEGMYHTETPLHWVASSDDVEAFEVLVKAGADIEALGGSIGGGTPLDNAVGYGQWQVARRLVECGARTKLWHAAALDLMSRVEADFADDPSPTPDDITVAYYQACAGGQRETAECLLGRGADINWIPDWDSKKKTPLDVARDYDSAINRRPPAEGLVEWLLGQGAKSAAELFA